MIGSASPSDGLDPVGKRQRRRRARGTRTAPGTSRRTAAPATAHCGRTARRPTTRRAAGAWREMRARPSSTPATVPIVIAQHADQHVEQEALREQRRPLDQQLAARWAGRAAPAAAPAPPTRPASPRAPRPRAPRAHPRHASQRGASALRGASTRIVAVDAARSLSEPRDAQTRFEPLHHLVDDADDRDVGDEQHAPSSPAR